MKKSTFLKNKYCYIILFINVAFILLYQFESRGAFLESPFPGKGYLWCSVPAVFILNLYVSDLFLKMKAILVFTFLPNLIFGSFGAYYNIFSSFFNSAVYLLLSSAISNATLKCCTKTKNAFGFTVFLHTGASVILYLISYTKLLNSFEKVFLISPLGRFMVLDVCGISFPELIFYFLLIIVLNLEKFNRDKICIMLTIFACFWITSNVSATEKLPDIRYIKNIELEFSVYDDYAIFYGNKINTKCKYSDDKEAAYNFLAKAKNYKETGVTLKNGRDKYFDVSVILTTNENLHIKYTVRNVSVMYTEKELEELRKSKDAIKNNPIFKTERVNFFTVNDEIPDMNMYRLIECIKKDVRENHINRVILYDVKFHEIRWGRALKTLCVSVGDNDYNTLKYIYSCKDYNEHTKIPERLRKYFVGFNVLPGSDFYELMKEKEYKREAGYVCLNLLPLSSQTRFSAFYVPYTKFVYLPEPKTKNGTVFIEYK